MMSTKAWQFATVLLTSVGLGLLGGCAGRRAAAVAPSTTAPAVELRAFWVDEFHAGIRTPQEAEQLVADAKRANVKLKRSISDQMKDIPGFTRLNAAVSSSRPRRRRIGITAGTSDSPTSSSGRRRSSKSVTSAPAREEDAESRAPRTAPDDAHSHAHDLLRIFPPGVRGTASTTAKSSGTL